MSEHLYEADKVRINNEAKVRTAASDPDFALREFEKWRVQKERRLKDETFVTAWAKVAWLAEGRMIAMGRELAKAQARIGRQRKANRELVGRVRQMEEALRWIDDEVTALLPKGCAEMRRTVLGIGKRARDAGDSTHLEQGERHDSETA